MSIGEQLAARHERFGLVVIGGSEGFTDRLKRRDGWGRIGAGYGLRRNRDPRDIVSFEQFVRDLLPS